jgi:hypothetical protein
MTDYRFESYDRVEVAARGFDRAMGGRGDG